MMVEVKVQGQSVLIDVEDISLFERYNWNYHPKLGVSYSERIDGKTVTFYLHRMILDCPYGMQVDHRNRCNWDNRRANLRLATPSENRVNSEKRKTNGAYGLASKFKGVSYYKPRGTWRARIQVDGEQKCLGYFGTEIEAAKAYNKTARELHGDFAVLNTLEGKIL